MNNLTQLRILITGGRDFQDHGYVFDTLDQYLLPLKNANTLHSICHGASVGGGVDSFAHDWAISRNVLSIPYAVTPDEWALYGNNAPRRRNQRMLNDYQPNLGIIFPGVAGTRDMRQRLNDNNINLLDFTKDYFSQQ